METSRDMDSLICKQLKSKRRKRKHTRATIALSSVSVTIKVRIKTVPLKQWDVGRELRRRLKKAYDAAGIAFPYPTQTHHMIPEKTPKAQ